MESPNILLLSVDCLRADVVYDDKPNTPFLDHLMNNHTFFKNHFSTGGWTAPSFIGMMTGEHPRSYDTDLSINAYPETLGESLLDQGYDTFSSLDGNYWISESQGFARGIEDFNNSISSRDYVKKILDEKNNEKKSPNQERMEELLPNKLKNRQSVIQVLKFLIRHPKIKNILSNISKIRDPKVFHGVNSRIGGNKINSDIIEKLGTATEPFFGWAHYMDLHHPYLPNRERILDHIMYPNHRINAANIGMPFKPEKDIEFLKKLYDKKVKELDGILKSLVESIGQSEFERDIILIITGDHGEEFGEHGRVGHANYPYNELLHVPLIVTGLGNKTVNRYTSSIDFKQAIEAIADSSPCWEQQFSSSPKCRTIDDGVPNEDRTYAALNGFEGASAIHSVIKDGFKIMYNNDLEEFEVYNIEKDPLEQNNLDADDHENIVSDVITERYTEIKHIQEPEIIESLIDDNF